MSERACAQAVRARMQRREIEEDVIQGSKTLAHNLSLTHFTKKLVSPVEKGSNTGRVQRWREAGVTQTTELSSNKQHPPMTLGEVRNRSVRKDMGKEVRGMKGLRTL